MTLEYINELINRGIAGFALMIIAFVLVVHVLQKDIEKSRKSK